MKNKMMITGLTMMSAMSVYAMTQEADACGLGETQFKVQADVLNVRPEPNTSKSAIAKLTRNSKVTILELSNGWGKIKLSNGKIGWISMNYVSQIDNCTIPSEKPISKGVVFVNTSALNLRERPTTSSYSKAKLSKGTSLEVYNESNGWLYVSNGNEYGWVSKSYTTSSLIEEEYEITGKVYDDITGELRWFERTVYAPASTPLNIRKAPTTKSSVVATTSRYNKIFVSGIKDGFYQVRGIDDNGNHFKGFAHSRYIF